MMNESLRQLTLVRFREFYREPEAVFWVFIFPILMSAGLGLAFRNRPADVLHVATSDTEIAAALRKDPGLAVKQLDRSAADRGLRTGTVVLLAERAANGVVYRYDDTNPDARTARLLADRALQRHAGFREAIAARDELVREPGSRYIDFVVPGLLGMGLLGNGVWGLGFAIVDARRRKLLKRLVASPMPRHEYLLSFLLSRLGLLVIEVTVLVGFAIVVFGVPVRGPLYELAFLCVLSSLAFSALGLLLASRAQTIEAVSGLMNFVMLPMWVLSGVFFSAERFPAAFQPFIRALPLTAVIDALRASMLQGTRVIDMRWQLAVIASWLVVGFMLALRLFRWK